MLRILTPTVLSLLALALGFGQGSDLRAPLAIDITGGLTSASVATLCWHTGPPMHKMYTDPEDMRSISRSAFDLALKRNYSCRSASIRRRISSR